MEGGEKRWLEEEGENGERERAWAWEWGERERDGIRSSSNSPWLSLFFFFFHLFLCYFFSFFLFSVSLLLCCSFGMLLSSLSPPSPSEGLSPRPPPLQINRESRGGQIIVFVCVRETGLMMTERERDQWTEGKVTRQEKEKGRRVEKGKDGEKWGKKESRVFFFFFSYYSCFILVNIWPI